MKAIREFRSSIVTTNAAISRVFRTLWPEHSSSIMAFFWCALLLSFVPFATQGANALLMNEVIARWGRGPSAKMFWFLAMLIGASIASNLLNSYRLRADKRLWTDAMEFLERLLMKKRSEFDVATLESPKFQDLADKVRDKNVFPVMNLVENQFQQLTNVFQAATAAWIFLVFDWRICLLAALTAVPDFFVQLKYGKTSWDIWDEDAQTRRRYGSIRHHFMSRSWLTELKIFQNVAHFFEMAMGMLKSFNDKQRDLDAAAYRWRILAALAASGVRAAIYVWIALVAAYGYITIGKMAFLLGSLAQFQSALTGFFINLAYQLEWARYTMDMFTLLDMQPMIATHPDAARVSNDAPPLIEFRNVSFTYPEKDQLILRNINLTIQPGERLAIVGLNGAGKSTLIKLLMGFYNPTGGEILINGMDLRNLDRESWWACIATLFQNYAEYNFPVRNVIALGKSGGKVDEYEVLHAAEAAAAHDFIMKLPNDYEQMIGKEFDDGVDLSVGQSQKIALARAIYRKPNLMILDEPTASIDPWAEAEIFRRLLEESDGDQTQIIISHRFSTVRRANRICVIEDGIISELGTHEELMANPKTYAQLFELQAAGYR